MHLRDKLLGQTRYWAPADEPGAGAGDPPAAPPPVVADPPPAAPAADPPAGDPPAPAAPAPAKDWKDGRIGELTAKLNAKTAELAALKAAAPPPVQTPGESPEAFQARVDAAANEKAAEIALLNDWNSRCNAVAEQGKKEFPDFMARLGACQSVVNGQDGAEVAQFNAVISAAMETGEAHKLLHALGETPGEVKRLMALPPMKMAVEMAMRAAKLGAGPEAPEPSGAPKPITPVGSKGLHYDGIAPDSPNGMKLPIGQWMKMREKQAEEKGIQ